jgi:hypothetical protein
LCFLFVLSVVSMSSTSGGQHFFEIVADQDWGRARKADKRFACDDKELGPQLGETITLRTAS